MNVNLGYLGPAGTFTEETALHYMAENPFLKLKEYISIDRIVEDVAAGNIEQGIVPLENSLEGSVGITLDMLAGSPEVFIRRELIHHISHCLLVPPGVMLDDIEEIYSHIQAFSQCRSFLTENLPIAALIPVESTGSAAKKVSVLGGNKAAIAPSRASGIFGLDILLSDIQDGNGCGKNGNVTRFVIISKNDHPRTGSDKTSVLLSIKDGPGSLYNILGIFAGRDVNLTRIESRPARKTLGEYLFFIDFEGHREDANINKLLLELDRKVKYMKMLGSYPSSDLKNNKK